MKRQLFQVCCLLLLFIGACKQKKETIFATFQPITHAVYASGVVKGLNQYQVFAKTSGVLEEIYVNEGDLVKKGQRLFLIGNSSAKFNKENSEVAARFNATQNNLDKLEELRLNIEILKEKKNTDSLLFVRQQNLWQQNVGTQLEWEQKALNFKNAKANYETGLLRYKQLLRLLTFSDNQSKLNLQISNSMFNDFTVKSEIQGKVYDVMKKVGEMVNVQTPIAVVGDASAFYLELQVDEFDISEVQVGKQVFITMDSYKGKVFEGKISKIHPMMNANSKSFLVESVFVTLPQNLYPNLTAEANIVISTKEKALLIPRSYLIENDFVMLESGEKRQVKTGLMDYKMVEILSGISEADALVKP